MVLFYTVRTPSGDASSAGSFSILDPTSPNEMTIESAGDDEAAGETTTGGEDATTTGGEEATTTDGGE